MSSQSEKTVAINLLNLLNLLENFIKNFFDVDQIPFGNRILKDLDDDKRKKWTSEIVPKFNLEKNHYLNTILNSGAEKFILTLLNIAEDFKTKYVPEEYLQNFHNSVPWEEEKFSITGYRIDATRNSYRC